MRVGSRTDLLRWFVVFFAMMFGLAAAAIPLFYGDDFRPRDAYFWREVLWGPDSLVPRITVLAGALSATVATLLVVRPPSHRPLFCPQCRRWFRAPRHEHTCPRCGTICVCHFCGHLLEPRDPGRCPRCGVHAVCPQCDNNPLGDTTDVCPHCGAVWSCSACGYLMRRDATDPCPACGEPPLCHECGYELTGNTSGRCPECGLAIPRRTETPAD